MTCCQIRIAPRFRSPLLAAAFAALSITSFGISPVASQDPPPPGRRENASSGAMKHNDQAPIGIRLLQNSDQFRDAGGRNKTESLIIAAKAEELAKAVSGLVSPTEQNEVYIRTFLSAANAGLNEVASNAELFPKFRSTTQNPGAFVRQSSAKPGSIFALKTYQDNAITTIRDPEESSYFRIFGGEVDLQGDFPQIVALGYSISNTTAHTNTTAYTCTGTLIGKNVVLTAGHCYNNCNEFIGGQIFIGTTTSGPGRVIKVKKATQHPHFKRSPANGERHNDLTVLILQEDVTDVPCVGLAALNALNAHPASIRAVGFGNTDADGSNGYGVRRYVTIPIAAYCEAENEETKKLGADAGFEFVAGNKNLDVDSCTGDSGGGNFIKVASKWVLLGVTSRPTKIAEHLCGDGGIYERVDVQANQNWIRSIPDAHF